MGSMDREEFKRLMKPIADGLFGKQQGPRYEKPHYTVRPLNEMLKELAKVETVDYYRYAFSRDPINGKFTDEQRKSWAKEAVKCGKEYAQKIRQQYSTSEIQTIAKKLGLDVRYPDFPNKTDRVLFAEFHEPNIVEIYMDAMKKADKFLKDESISAIMKGHTKVSKIILAHEVFHYVEEKYSKEIFTQTEKTRLWSIGPVHNDSKVIAISEIAAMAFAEEINELAFSPYILDVLMVYGYDPEEASGLYEEICGYFDKEGLQA